MSRIERRGSPKPVTCRAAARVRAAGQLPDPSGDGAASYVARIRRRAQGRAGGRRGEPTRPISTGGGTRRVRLVRGVGRGVSDQCGGRGGGGRGAGLVVFHGEVFGEEEEAPDLRLALGADVGGLRADSRRRAVTRTVARTVTRAVARTGSRGHGVTGSRGPAPSARGRGGEEGSRWGADTAAERYLGALQ